MKRLSSHDILGREGCCLRVASRLDIWAWMWKGRAGLARVTRGAHDLASFHLHAALYSAQAACRAVFANASCMVQVGITTSDLLSAGATRAGTT